MDFVPRSVVTQILIPVCNHVMYVGPITKDPILDKDY